MVVSRDLQHEVEQFLFQEAKLLENRRFDEWLEPADQGRHLLGTERPRGQ